MYKKILTIFALLMLLVSVAAAQNSPQDFPMVHDEAKLMTTQQQQDLEQKLRALNDKYNIKVAVLTMKKYLEPRRSRKSGNTARHSFFSIIGIWKTTMAPLFSFR